MIYQGLEARIRKAIKAIVGGYHRMDANGCKEKGIKDVVYLGYSLFEGFKQEELELVKGEADVNVVPIFLKCK